MEFLDRVLDRDRVCISSKQFRMFCEQLVSMRNVDITVINSIDAIREYGSVSTKRFADLVYNRMRSGLTFGDSIMGIEGIDDDTVERIKLAESTNTLTQYLTMLITKYKTDEKIREDVKSALMYPAASMVLVGVAVVVLLTFVVPKFETALAAMNTKLPAITLSVVNASNFLIHDWWLIVLFVAFLVFLFKFVFKNKKFTFVDRALLKIPLFGLILSNYSLIAFYNTMGNMLEMGQQERYAFDGGITSIQSITMKEKFKEAYRLYITGESIVFCLDKFSCISPIHLQVLNIGAQSGTLSQSLLNLGKELAIQNDVLMERFKSVYPIVILILMGLIIGYIYLAVLAPEMQLTSAVSNA